MKITICVLLSWFWCSFQDLSHPPPPWHLCWLRASAEDIQYLRSSLLASYQHLIVCSPFSYCIPITAILDSLRQIMPLATRIHQFMRLFPGSLSLGGWWRWAERWQSIGPKHFHPCVCCLSHWPAQLSFFCCPMCYFFCFNYKAHGTQGPSFPPVFVQQQNWEIMEL